MANTILHIGGDKNIKLVIREDGFSILTLIGKKKCDGSLKPLFKQYKIKGIILREVIGDCVYKEIDKKIQQLSFFDNLEINAEVLHSFLNLEKIRLEFTYDMSIDFSKFPNLKEIEEIEWNINLDFSYAKTLRSVVVKFLDSKDFNKIFNSNIENIEVVKGKIESLDGIDKIKSLKALTMNSFPKLNNYEAVGKAEKLEFLRLSGCGSLKNISFIETCRNLKWITLENCKEIETLRPLEKLPNLIGVNIMGNTKILDGNKSICKSKSDTSYFYGL